MKNSSPAYFRKWAIILLSSLMVALYHYFSPGIIEKGSPPLSDRSLNDAPYYRVGKVIDGDTIVLNNGEHVRLIGIDAPESRLNPRAKMMSERSHSDLGSILAMGKISKTFLTRLIEGKEVFLEYDVQKKDRYGRTLAYVYYPLPEKNLQTVSDINAKLYTVKRDGREFMFLNATIIRSGYASPLTIAPDNTYAQLFSRLFQEAQSGQYGLWAQKPSEKTKKELVYEPVTHFPSR